MIRVGDIVKRFDLPGSGTGILYHVTHVGDEREFSIRSKGNWRRNKTTTRKLKLKPVIVMFESKWSTERHSVTHYECDVKKLDIVEIATELNKLHLFLQDEARRMGVPV